MASRSRGRELAVQVLYQIEYSPYDRVRVWEMFWKSIKADRKTRIYCEDLAEGVLDSCDELNQEISAYLKNWTLDRIVSIDQIILQIAFYELIFDRQIPWRVVVDEALALTRMFSSEQSTNFVNGILHAWATKNRKDTQDPNPPEEQVP